MAVELNSASYLLFSQLVNVDGIQFWDLPEFPDIFPQDDDIYVTIGESSFGRINSNDEELRIDLLSYRIYKTPHLWWIIARRNNFEVVPNAFKLNQTIVVPSPRYVFEEILPKARG